MRAVKRGELAEKTAAYMDTRKPRGIFRAETKVDADHRWENFKATAHHAVVKAALRAMNLDSPRCMYCEVDRSSVIDHFVPRELHPKLTLTWRNLNWSCGPCNTAKQAKFSWCLLNPTALGYVPGRHFELNRHTGAWRTKDTAAEVSAATYGLNIADLCDSRREACHKFEAYIIEYGRTAGTPRAQEMKWAIEHSGHPSVFHCILDIHAAGDPANQLDPRTRAALNAHPEIATWL